MALSVPQTLSVIDAQRGTALRLRAGETLRIVAIEAEQVADLALYDAGDPRDGFSPGRTIDYNETLDLRAGSLLYSNRSVPLAQVIEDTTGVHDMLLTPCSRVMFQRRGQNAHASCHENLYTNLARFGITSDDVAATINVFMDVRINSDRTVAIFPPASKPGDRFSVRASREILVGITACSSELTNAGRCKPISFEVLPSP